MNFIRQIDYLRAFQISDRLGNMDCDTLIELCCNADTFIDQVIICQNLVHQQVRELRVKIIKDTIIDQLQLNQDESRNGNIDQKDDQKDDQKNNSQELQQQPQQQPSQQSIGSPAPAGAPPSQQQSQLSQQRGSQPDVPANFNVNPDQNEQQDHKSQDYRLVELSKSTEKALLESWLDKAYSHLRTFQYDGPTFSNNTEIFDNSAKTTTTLGSDPQFPLKDMVIHVAQRTRINPNDYIRIRFSSPSIVRKKGNMDYIIRLGTVMHESRGIFDFFGDTDFVTLSYRINDFDYAQMNDEKRYETQLRDWTIQHNKVGKQMNRPDHPGPPPVLKNSSELALYEKIIDKSNSTYHITTSDGSIKPIRNGIVRWNQEVQYQN